MIAKARKAAVCMTKTTVKIQSLLKDFSPFFEDESKQHLNEAALYYHKHQNGLIKISRWSFAADKEQALLIEKGKLAIETDSLTYNYADTSDEETQVFWVQFSGTKLFYDCDKDSFSQSDILALEHPLLLSCARFIESLTDKNFSPLTKDEKGNPTPFVFQNVPLWIQTSVTHNPADFKVIPYEAKNCILSMRAPVGTGAYTVRQITVLLSTVLTAFGGAVKSAAELKKKNCVIHTGNWGCGNFGNNEELIYLVQMIGASALQVKRIVFHAPETAAFNRAQKRFESLPAAIKFTDLITALFDMNFYWKHEDVDSQLGHMGLWRNMSVRDYTLWEKRQKLIHQTKNIALEKIYTPPYYVAAAYEGFCTVGELVSPKRTKTHYGKTIQIILQKLLTLGIHEDMQDEDWQAFARTKISSLE